MPVGKGASATLKALQSDQDFVNETKETEQKKCYARNCT